MSVADKATLVHGFTMADVDAASRIAARRHIWAQSAFNLDDREQMAWHGIAEYLYDCGCGKGWCTRTQAVTFKDLVSAGLHEIDVALSEKMRHHGRGKHGEERPSFTQYWLPIRRSEYGQDNDGFSEQLCERIALRSALSTLTPLEYEAIATLAAFDNYAVGAARALGVKESAYRTRVSSARKRIAAVWFGDETPRTSKPTGETCRVGHSRAEHGYQDVSGRWVCRKCRTNHRRRWRARNKSTSDAEPDQVD